MLFLTGIMLDSYPLIENAFHVLMTIKEISSVMCLVSNKQFFIDLFILCNTYILYIVIYIYDD